MHYPDFEDTTPLAPREPAKVGRHFHAPARHAHRWSAQRSSGGGWFADCPLANRAVAIALIIAAAGVAASIAWGQPA